MSVGIQIRKAELLIKDVESYVNAGDWHSGKNCQAISEIMEVEIILNVVEQSPPPILVQLYLDRIEKVSELRGRLSVAEEHLPENPWGLFEDSNPIVKKKQ
jgi:hypothetical protein